MIDNRPGGGTTIGTKAAMGAEPDGYTLLFSNTPTLLIVAGRQQGRPLRPAQGLRSDRDRSPAARTCMVIAPSLPARTVQEFVAYAKANPGKLNFGFGQGTQPQLIGEMFKLATGVNIANIPYKGGAQAIPDMLGGRIQMNIGTLVDAAAAARERQGARARGHQHETQPAAAGRADHGGKRPAGGDFAVLLRHLRPARTAGRDRRQNQRGHERER